MTSVPTGGRTVTVTATGYDDQSASATVTDGATITVDFALTSTSSPTDDPPSVSITEPLNFATVGGKRVKLRADASDDNDVTLVEFFLAGGPDGLASTFIGDDGDNSDGILIRWDSKTVTNGPNYELTAVAADNASQSTISNTVFFTVDNGGGSGSSGPNCPPNSNKPACR